MIHKFKQNPDERNQKSQRIKRETDWWCAEATKLREVEGDKPDGWRSAFVVGGGSWWWWPALHGGRGWREEFWGFGIEGRGERASGGRRRV
jgi:hypothetical protein